MKNENGAIIKEWLDEEKRRHQVVVSIGTVLNKAESPHWFAIEYVEIRPGVWQKVYGTEKDLGIKK